MIERAGPFGSGNPEPVIALPAHTVAYAEEVGQAHVRVRLQIRRRRRRQRHRVPRRRPEARRCAAAAAAAGRSMPPARFAIDRWQGEERVQFRLVDIAPAEPFAGR